VLEIDRTSEGADNLGVGAAISPCSTSSDDAVAAAWASTTLIVGEIDRTSDGAHHQGVARKPAPAPHPPDDAVAAAW
jgi:hypothetical protein